MLTRPIHAAAIGLTLACSVVVTGCADTCGNSAVASVASPDGAHNAVVFQRDCGASTGFSTQVSVLADNSAPIDGGNVFIADDNHGAAASGSWGGPWAQVRWLSSDHLLIRHAAGSQIFRQEDSQSGVRVSYESVGFSSEVPSN